MHPRAQIQSTLLAEGELAGKDIFTTVNIAGFANRAVPDPSLYRLTLSAYRIT